MVPDMAAPASTSVIVKRFNVAQDRLVFQTSDLPLGTISDMVTANAIDLQPEYQRRERWSADKRSALIESFLLNVPVPPVYLAEEDYGVYSVIDGKQRIAAIHDFLRGGFALQGLHAFTEVGGHKFAELPADLQNALTIRPYLRAITLLRQSDPTLKYEVFERLNTGGEALNAQEIRNVAFRGDLNDVIYELSSHEFLRQQLKIRNDKSAAYRQMQDAEYVLRFLTLNERWNRFSGDLRLSMDRFMLEHTEEHVDWLEAQRASFLRSIDWCRALWGDNAFHRPAGQNWRDQTLAGMYDAEMIGVSLTDDSDLEKAGRNTSDVLRMTRRLFADSAFEEAVRVGTNTPARIVFRVQRLHEALTALVG
jgi:hypothetical protein